MIVEHRTLLNITKIVVKVTENRQHGTFSPSVVLDQETKKLIKNILQPELRLKMIVEPRTLISLTKSIARVAGNNQHVTFSSTVAFCAFKLCK